MTRLECWHYVWKPDLLAYVVGVIFNNIFEAFNSSIIDFGQIGFDVVVEVDFYDRVLGFIRIASVSTVVPVPVCGIDKELVIW